MIMENFYLKQNEEFFSIIDKIKASRDEDIVLIIPTGISALKSIVNLRILKEESDFLGKNIFIITADPLIQRLSQQVGIRILDKQEEIELPKKKEKTGRVVDLRPKGVMADIVSKKKIEIEEEPKEIFEEEPVFSEPLPFIKKEKIKKEKIKRQREFKFFTRKFWITALVIIGILGLSYVVYFVLPRAQVIITPKKEKVNFDTEITVDKNINSLDEKEGKIPGQFFQLEDSVSKEFPTTGEKEVEEKAKGTITVYNQYSSSPQTLVKTTRFKATDGKIFRLVDTVTIPGATIDEGKIIASSKDVAVIADEAGEAYNIGPSKFTIPGFEGSPKYAAFYGQSSGAMSGGAKGKMKVATKDDIDGATNIVIIEVKDKVKKEFQEKIPQELKLLDGAQSLEVTESSSNLKANQPGERFVVTVKAKASGLAFKEQDALFLAGKIMNGKISENKTLLLSTIKINYQSVKNNFTQGETALTCKVEADAAWNFDEEKIKNDLAGKNETDVKTYLSSVPEIESTRVIFWPFWVKKIPSNKNKIKVISNLQ